MIFWLQIFWLFHWRMWIVYNIAISKFFTTFKNVSFVWSLWLGIKWFFFLWGLTFLLFLFWFRWTVVTWIALLNLERIDDILFDDLGLFGIIVLSRLNDDKVDLYNWDYMLVFDTLFHYIWFLTNLDNFMSGTFA